MLHYINMPSVRFWSILPGWTRYYVDDGAADEAKENRNHRYVYYLKLVWGIEYWGEGYVRKSEKKKELETHCTV